MADNNNDIDIDNDDDTIAAAIVTPAPSKEYEEMALEKLWNGAWTESAWNALAAAVGMEYDAAAAATTTTAVSTPPPGGGVGGTGGLCRFRTMMVQDIQNPEYIRQPNDDQDPTQCCWTERTPINLVAYPPPTTTTKGSVPVVRADRAAQQPQPQPQQQHRDKRQRLGWNDAAYGATRTHPNHHHHSYDRRCGRHPDPTAAAAVAAAAPMLRAHFYFDQYPTPSAQERLKINELVDVVAVRASLSSLSSSSSPMGASSTSSSSQRTSDTVPDREEAVDDDEAMMEDDQACFGSVRANEEHDYFGGTNDTTDDDEGGWHVLWYRRRSLYDGLGDAVVTPSTVLLSPVLPTQRPDFAHASLADQALALLLYSRTERTVSGLPMVTPDQEQKLVGCATVQWIVHDVHQRNDLLSALPAPYTILRADQVITTRTPPWSTDEQLIPRRDPRTGRLRHSPLQLPAGALLVLDLTDINTAISNTTTATATTTVISSVVRRVLATHRLDYCFDGGVSIPFEADYRILVITTPHCLCHDLLPPESTFTIAALPPNLFRPQQQHHDHVVVACGLPRLSERVDLPGSLLESVVHAYATYSTTTATTTGQAKSEALLHRWLIATRSIARYHGHSTATLTDFEMAYRVESQLRASWSAAAMLVK